MAPLIAAIPGIAGESAGAAAPTAAGAVAPAATGAIGAGTGIGIGSEAPLVSQPALAAAGDVAGTAAQAASAAPAAAAAPVAGVAPITEGAIQTGPLGMGLGAGATEAGGSEAPLTSTPALLNAGGGYAGAGNIPTATPAAPVAQKSLWSILAPMLQRAGVNAVGSGAGQAAGNLAKPPMSPPSTGQVSPTQSLGPTAVPGTQNFAGANTGGIMSYLQQLLQRGNPQGGAI